MAKHYEKNTRKMKNEYKSDNENLGEFVEKKKKEKNKKRLTVKTIIFLLFFAVFIFSSVNLIRWTIYNKKSSDLINTLAEESFIENDEKETSNNNTEIQGVLLNKNPVNFENLEKINSDTVGWIRIKDTSINYPIVQSSNNEYYLHKDFNKDYSTCGWIFMDFKNSENFIDMNTVLYGHNIKSGIMFSDLKKILRNELGNEVIIEIYTKTEKLEYRVFSSYLKEPDDYAIKSNIVDEDTQNKYINEMLKRSNTVYNIVPDKSDKLLTLSTCDNSGENRILIHSVYVGGEKFTN